MSAQGKSPFPQWWKAWVLLAGAGITVTGSFALSGDEAAPVRSAIEPPAEVTAARIPPQGVERLARVTTSPRAPRIGTLPAMPARPQFVAPVTRTRRS